jgi:uncharacterized protein YunC (DUF1805 family)
MLFQWLEKSGGSLMNEIAVDVGGKRAVGYVIPMGSANIVFTTTDVGFVGCGVFDVTAFDKFNIPAAKVPGIATVDDLLAGAVKDVNESARQRGIQPGMTGRQALEKM